MVSGTRVRPARDGYAVARGASVAAAVLLAGFGAMVIFWRAGDHDPALPGLTAYASATFGDGVLLPVLAGGLAWAAARLPGPPSRRDWRWAAGAAGLGLAGGAATIATWLADADPVLNWTLPEPGRFTAAGWYHAGFLCLASASLTGLATLVLVRWRFAYGSDPVPTARAAAGSGPTLLLFVGLSFVWLVVHDSLAGRATAAATASVIGVLGGVVVCGVLVATVTAGVRVDRRALLAGSLLALGGSLGLAVATVRLDRHDVAFRLIATGTALALALSTGWRMRLVRVPRWPALAVLIGATLLGSLAATPADPETPGGVLVPLASVAALALMLSLAGVAAPGPAHWISVLIILAMLALAPWVRGTTQAVALATLGFAVLFIQLVYVLIEWFYRRAASFTADTRDVPPTAPSAVAVLLPLGLAAVVAYFYLAVNATIAAGFESKTSAQPWVDRPWLPLTGVLLVVSVAPLSAARSVAKGRVGSDRRAEVPGVALVALALGTAGWVAALAVTFRPAPNLWGWYVVAAAGVSVVLALLSAEAIVMTVVLLQDRAPTVASNLLALLAGLAVLTSTVWFLMAGVWAGDRAATLPAALGAMGVALAGGYGIAAMCGLTLAISGGQPQITEDPPWFNALQDQALYAALGAFGVSSAAIAFARSPDRSAGNLGGALLQLASFLGPFALLFVFVLYNNFQHFARQKARVVRLSHDTGRPADPDRWFRHLRTHVAVQTTAAALIALLIVVGAVVTFLAGMVDGVRYLAQREQMGTRRPSAPSPVASPDSGP